MRTTLFPGYELEMMDSFGDNDTLSAVITGLIGADFLILLSDLDGLFTDDPNSNPDAEFIHVVEKLDEKLLSMGKGPKSKVGTGGMATKLTAAEIATGSRRGHGHCKWRGFPYHPQDRRGP